MPKPAPGSATPPRAVITNALGGRGHEVTVRTTGDDVEVTVRYDYRPVAPWLVPGVQEGVLTLTHTSTYRIEPQ